MAHRAFVVVFIIIAALGFLDATFLTVKHFEGGVLPCVLTTGCESVTTSKYASVAGVPIALFGAIYYGSLFLAALFYLSNRNGILFQLFTRGATIGVLVSLWLVYLQLFVIHALCIYCLVSAGSSTALFILGLWLIYNRHRDTKPLT